MHIFTSFLTALALCFGALAPACAQGMAKVRSLNNATATDTDGWRHLGTGTMIDGWVTPGLTPNAGEELNPMNYAFEVEVYESTATPGTYKLASPYTSDKFPFVTKNENTTPHDIVIDATNPNFVRVEPQESGFVNTDKSRANYSDPFYIGNAGCYFNEEEGYGEADIISYGYNSTLKDGVINIVSPRFGKAPKGAAFGYNWQGEYATVVTLPKEQPAELWKAAGKASFTDGFLSPGFSANPATYTWDVDIEESSVSAGVYRLVNPYGTDACPLAGKNTETSPAYIRIDASDPDVVVIEPQYAGFKAMHSGELIQTKRIINCHY